LLRTSATGEQVRASWLGPGRPSHHYEAADVYWIRFDERELARFEKSRGASRVLHPTARARIRLALTSGL
jgi:hypothetical protein